MLTTDDELAEFAQANLTPLMRAETLLAQQLSTGDHSPRGWDASPACARYHVTMLTYSIEAIATSNVDDYARFYRAGAASPAATAIWPGAQRISIYKGKGGPL